MNQIKVLIIDDSPIVRKVLSRQLSAAQGIKVIGTAPDPYVARDIIVRDQPDVLTLDIEMPRMDGITFLKKLMKSYPLPVIIVSSLTPKGSARAMEAFAAGAVDVVAKPGQAYAMEDMGKELARKIKTAVRAKITIEEPPLPAAFSALTFPCAAAKVIAIGASTGGTEAIRRVITRFPENCPGVVVVQHMPAQFTANFANRLDDLCPMHVREARDGDPLSTGTVLIAPGGYHMLLDKKKSGYYVRVKDGPPVHHQRPAVDVLFSSVAQCAGPQALGIILTGMGADGAAGIRAMKTAGSFNIAQNEASCVVYGMPREAVKLGGIDISLDIDEIAEAALNHLS